MKKTFKFIDHYLLTLIIGFSIIFIYFINFYEIFILENYINSIENKDIIMDKILESWSIAPFVQLFSLLIMIYGGAQGIYSTIKGASKPTGQMAPIPKIKKYFILGTIILYFFLMLYLMYEQLHDIKNIIKFNIINENLIIMQKNSYTIIISLVSVFFGQYGGKMIDANKIKETMTSQKKPQF